MSDAGCLLRVLMISTSYPANLADWRGVFIRHLAMALARRDDLTLSLWSPLGDIPERARWVATTNEGDWLTRLMEAGGIAHEVRTNKLRGLLRALQLLGHLRRMYKRESQVDVLHINWLQNALPLPNNGAPLLVTVLGTDMRLLSLPTMTPLLRRVFRGRRVVICPNAQWMVDELERRFSDVARIRYVPFGIDPRWFSIQRVASSAPKWLCVSRVTEDKLGDLLEWGQPHFADGRRELHLLGPMQEQLALPNWVHYHGPTDPDALCERWFPQATGLITLSQHAEGRPQVMLEAMASGLPIVASTIPAHQDLLKHGETGWLCAATEQLGSLLVKVEADEGHVGARAREWVAEAIGTWDDCAGRYAYIYTELTSRAAWTA